MRAIVVPRCRSFSGTRGLVRMGAMVTRDLRLTGNCPMSISVMCAVTTCRSAKLYGSETARRLISKAVLRGSGVLHR